MCLQIVVFIRCIYFVSSLFSDLLILYMGCYFIDDQHLTSLQTLIIFLIKRDINNADYVKKLNFNELFIKSNLFEL